LALHVEQLIREALGREPNEEPAQSPGELGGQSPPGDDDARMAPPRIEPAAVQTLEVDAVVGYQHAADICGEGELFLVRSPQLPGVPGGRGREAPSAQHCREHHGDVFVAVKWWEAVRHPDA
jgi:hypothetical protein